MFAESHTAPSWSYRSADVCIASLPAFDTEHCYRWALSMATPPVKLYVWFPTVRANSGSDVFTERLAAGLLARGIGAEITWLPHRAEFVPWTVSIPQPPHAATIVHTNTWLHSRFVPRHLPHVTTVHHCVHDDRLTPYKSLAQKLYHRFWVRSVESRNVLTAQLVTAVSDYSSKMAGSVFGRDNIVSTKNGVDVRVFHPDGRDLPNRPFRLLYAGNWLARKGVDLLGPIMSALGDGFELHYTADRNHGHKRYALPPNCICIGKPPSTEAMADAYRTADALLFPSRLEGFGLVAAEAMACGIPVIAANSSALPEVVDHGRTGMLCELDSVTAFAQAARALAENLDLWRAMRANAVIHARRDLAESVQIDRYVELYRRLVTP